MESFQLIREAVHNWLAEMGTSELIIATVLGTVICTVGLFTACLAYRIVLTVILNVAHRVARRTQTTLDDELLETRILHRLAHLAPVIVINTFNTIAFTDDSGIALFIKALTQIYLIVVVLSSGTALLDFIGKKAQETVWGVKFPVKGVTQAINLIITLVAIILVLSVLLNKSPAILLSGIGALTAILMLIFKDTILGFTAGIMLSANKLVSIGDWIEVPSANADGDVVDITLTTVLVQNFDKTITSIPAYDLVAKAFKNWRGMTTAGGRRIKRALHIDMQSVRFADEKMIARWQKINLLRPYLTEKLAEIESSNMQKNLDMSVLGNGRRITNLGTFRAYCVAYLKSHPSIHQRMLIIVRQLSPTEHGLPLEVYAFTNSTNWVFYEGVQSDIFDHLMAIINEFGLEIYQRESDCGTRHRTKNERVTAQTL